MTIVVDNFISKLLTFLKKKIVKEYIYNSQKACIF